MGMNGRIAWLSTGARTAHAAASGRRTRAGSARNGTATTNRTVEHEDHGDTGAQPAELESHEQKDAGPGKSAGGGGGQQTTTRRCRPAAG